MIEPTAKEKFEERLKLINENNANYLVEIGTYFSEWLGAVDSLLKQFCDWLHPFECAGLKSLCFTDTVIFKEAFGHCNTHKVVIIFEDFRELVIEPYISSNNTLYDNAFYIVFKLYGKSYCFMERSSNKWFFTGFPFNLQEVKEATFFTCLTYLMNKDH